MEDTQGHLDALLTDKVKEIIESRWGKCMEDVKVFSVEQLYQRLVQNNRISYRPTNMFILEASFNKRDTRRTRFCLPAS